MKGAGLTVGGFYADFASKEKLIDATLRRIAAAMRERLFTRIEDKPHADRAEVVLKRYLSAAHRDDLSGGCPLPAVVGEVGTTAGHLPATGSLSRRHVALGIVALMYGGLSLARAVRGTDLSDEILRACRSLGRLATRSQPETP
jgi:TetR/AcrR family transcriptional repressor of nem operon